MRGTTGLTGGSTPTVWCVHATRAAERAERITAALAAACGTQPRIPTQATGPLLGRALGELTSGSQPHDDGGAGEHAEPSPRRPRGHSAGAGRGGSHDSERGGRPQAASAPGRPIRAARGSAGAARPATDRGDAGVGAGGAAAPRGARPTLPGPPATRRDAGGRTRSDAPQRAGHAGGRPALTTPLRTGDLRGLADGRPAPLARPRTLDGPGERCAPGAVRNPAPPSECGEGWPELAAAVARRIGFQPAGARRGPGPLPTRERPHRTRRAAVGAHHDGHHTSHNGYQDGHDDGHRCGRPPGRRARPIGTCRRPPASTGLPGSPRRFADPAGRCGTPDGATGATGAGHAGRRPHPTRHRRPGHPRRCR